MIQRLALLIIAIAIGTPVFAQRPQPISIQGKIGVASNPTKNECGNEAGTITIGPHTGTSNDVAGDTIFLCLGDQIFIDSDNPATTQFDGDPNTSTPPGIGYAFYTCEPTVEGTDLATVLTDPCLLPNTIDPNNSIFVAVSPDNSGDITFNNGGALQTQFSNGDPLLLWFAPITYDELVTFAGVPVAQYEEAAPGEAAGPCVDVSIDQAFTVLYLNEVNVANTQVNPQQGCRGSFQVQGGLSEFDGSNYTVNIELDNDSSVTGTILNPNGATHGSSVQFSVPQAGTYNIIVSDGKACPGTGQITFNTADCSPVTFRLPNINFAPGATNVCVDVTVNDFNEILGFQYPIEWDPSILSFNEITNLSSDLPTFSVGESFGTTRAEFGELSIAWADLNDFIPVTLPDNTVIFSICFDAVGNEGACSPLAFSPSGIPPVEVTRNGGEIVGFNGINGQVCISNESFFLEITSVDESCDGNEDARISFEVSGGIPPYNYELVDASNMIVPGGTGTITTASGSINFDDIIIEPGDYQIIVVDSNTSSDIAGEVVGSDIFTIGAGLRLGVNIQIQSEILCAGDADGVIRAAVSENGFAVTVTDEYIIEWRTEEDGPVIGTDPLLRDIEAGREYFVTVIKGDCSRMGRGSFTSPPPLQASIQNLEDATCEGVEDGNIAISITGGSTINSGTYEIAWSNLATSFNIPALNPAQQGSLAPGMYSITATDENGCTTSIDFDISADRFLETDVAIGDVLCFGGEDGRVEVMARSVGGSEARPYSFTWASSLDVNSLPQDTEISSTIDNLGVGEYILIVQDDDGCMTQDTFEVVQPEELIIAVTEQLEASCVGGLMDGAITVAASGGTPTYIYTWPTIAGLATANATSLSPGSYEVIVTDANGCEAESNIIAISAPDLPNILPITEDRLDCFGGMDGQLSASAEPGPSGANITSYEWSNGDMGQNTGDDLIAGGYILTVTDSDGCFAVDTAFVTQPDPIGHLFSMPQNPSCPGRSDGRVFLEVLGGTGPYTIDNLDDELPAGLTSSNESGLFFVNLQGDIQYNFEITDASGCPSITVDTILTSPPNAAANFAAIDSTSCADLSDGGATVTALFEDGSSGLFNFAWTNSGQTDDNTTMSRATDLPSGLNIVNISYRTAADSICSFEATVEIPSPEAILAIAGAMGVSCFGDTDGTAEIITSGGSAPYRFNWDDGGLGANRTDLAPDDYIVTITDANDCTASTNITVLEPELLVLSIDSTRDVTCQGDEDGVIGLSVQGGNPLGVDPFTWPNNVAGASDSLANSLVPGAYEITVTDQNNCMATVAYTVTEPTAITAAIPTPDEPQCFGLQTIIEVMAGFGGNGAPYSFSVNGQRPRFIDEVFTEFGGQEHQVTVFDVLGCRFDTTIFIDQPPQLEVELPEMIEIQLGDSLNLDPDIFSVQDIESFAWTPDDFLSSINIQRPSIRPLDDRNYTVVVTDVNGCEGRASILVAVDKKRNVYVPNAFSPDFNGFNDQFQVFTGAGVTGILSMRVYDRWGEVLYTAENLPPSPEGSQGWDGTFKGKDVAEGVYVYMIEVSFLDEVRLTYRGDVTVVR